MLWIIEGRAEPLGTEYYLREVFYPTNIGPAKPEDSPGARKKFSFTIDGEGTPLGKGILLNPFPWFPGFRDENGNFGFGLDNFRNITVREHFQEIARPYFVEKR